MGTHENVGADRFPRQHERNFRRAAEVCFDYDASRTFRATIVRCDVEAPWLTVLQLNDGRVVLSTECQYRPLGE